MRPSSRSTQTIAKTGRMLLPVALVIWASVGPLWAPLLEDCNGAGDIAQYEGSITVHTMVCTSDEDWGPLASCALGSASYGLWSCLHPAPPPGGGGYPPSGPGTGPTAPPPQPPANPRDANRDGKIDCWKLVVNSTADSPNLEPHQLLGTCYGGENVSPSPPLKPDRQSCHSGIDLDCNIGDPVYAAHDGEIYLAGPQPPGNGGTVVMILGTDGNYYDVLHLSAVANGIVQGQPVKAGALIGYCGMTGVNETLPAHVHLRTIVPGTGSCGCAGAADLLIADPRPFLPCVP